MKNTTLIGNKAESVVANYLQKKGYHIIERNFRAKTCEIDLIACKERVIYFIEVKFRSRSDFGDGIEYVSSTKLNRMKHACEYWCYKKDWNGDIILAVASVGSKNYHVERFEILD